MNGFDNLKIYKPLPDFLEIKKSKIHGYGLFAKNNIDEKIEFGITHIRDERFLHNYARTPLGGFFNHSIEPNCEAYYEGDLIKLRSVKKIIAGEEITVNYTLHDWCKVK
ncbi:MAG: SET domain-containing protein [Candidatus Neomarinimicrobiota bacterium]|nr:SET domain-containing protein [Candidatus Neomarinimicrobiota bacterium]